MIVAEMGVNWDWDNLDPRIHDVANTGCRWIKFQLFHKKQVDKQFQHLVINHDDCNWIKHRCESAGMTAIFTPMYRKAIAWCNERHIKIRYKDKDDTVLCKAASEKADCLWISGNNVLCVPQYPADLNTYIMKVMKGLRDIKHHHKCSKEASFTGISYHIPNIDWINSVLGEPYAYIEHHVFFDEQKDHERPWSINMMQLADLVGWYDEATKEKFENVYG